MRDQGQKMRSESYIQEAVAQLLALKLRAGSSISELQQFTSACIENARLSVGKIERHQGLDIHRLGSILRAWHTETKFLTDEGLPRPLRLLGRHGLKALIVSYYPPSKVDVVFKRLRSTSLIRPHGREAWLPTGRHARISQLSYETLEHLSEGVARYVETVISNVTAPSEKGVLFERSCKVTRLPAKEFGAFRDYVAEQAIAFITAVDDWLESRNALPGKNSIRVNTAGVYTFAYVDRKGATARK